MVLKNLGREIDYFIVLSKFWSHNFSMYRINKRVYRSLFNHKLLSCYVQCELFLKSATKIGYNSVQYYGLLEGAYPPDGRFTTYGRSTRPKICFTKSLLQIIVRNRSKE